MTRVSADGYFDAENSEERRYEKKKVLNAQRTADYRSGEYTLGGDAVDLFRGQKKNQYFLLSFL